MEQDAVLNVTASRSTLEDSHHPAYAAWNRIDLAGRLCRRDIAGGASETGTSAHEHERPLAHREENVQFAFENTNYSHWSCQACRSGQESGSA